MKRLELWLTVAMVIAAVSIAAAAVQRSFFSGPVRVSVGTQPDASEPVDDSLWQEARQLSRAASASEAGTTIIVFDDFECPACKEFHRRVRSLEETHPGKFQLRLVHYPLSYHRFALPAAKVTECVSSDAQFINLVDELFAAQDSLGLVEWSDVLLRAGVENPNEIAKCAALPDSSARFRRLQDGRRLADFLGVSATPTVVIEGRKYLQPPSNAELLRVLADPN